MVEDITTGLSRVRSLFVIARNSAFTYKGRTIDVKQIGRELGVRYVLEGSVRKAGNRVRITGQLVEAVSGTHIWADRFDGTLEDVFVLQDRVTTSVVAAIAPAVRTAEMVRALRTPTTIPQAYDLSMRALSLHRSQTRSGLEEGASLLRQAIALDPNFALGIAQLSYVCWNIVAQGWVDRADSSVADMASLAQRALAMDAEDPEILAIVGLVTALPGGDLKGGIALLDKSIALNPNSALALRIAGSLHAYAGEMTPAMTCLEQAERLNPFDNGPLGYSARIIAHFVAGAYDAAVEWSDRALRDSPRHGASLRFRVASLGLLGHLDEARQTVQRLLELVPGFTIAHARHHFEYNMNNVFKTPGVAEAYYEGLRRAGVPES
jgi:adenylate cyclase